MVRIKQINREELEQIVRLRYQIYVAEMNRPQKYADHEARTIVDPLDATGHILAAVAEHGVVGTVRVNFCQDGTVGDYAQFYEIDRELGRWAQSSITTRLMVKPEYRGTRGPLQLAHASFCLGLEQGTRWNYIDCNPPLLRFFERLGYVERFMKHHPEYGHVHCMRLDLHDTAHLAAVGSPFLSSSERYLAAQEGSQAESIRVGVGEMLPTGQ